MAGGAGVVKKVYSYWFLLPIGIVYIIIFIVPTLMSFFFSMTWWNLTEWRFIGFENFATFFTLRNTNIAMANTLVYAVATCALKVVIGLFLGAFLCSGLKSVPFLRSMVFFPTLLSTMAVGITFSSLMHPTKGLINSFLALFGVEGPDWLGNVNLALGSVIFTDVWKGVGLATVIYIAGIMSIDRQYYEAADIDGGGSWQKFWHITVPLCRPAMNAVIILSFIGGLRTFDLVWVMTGGGPGFTTDLMASAIYKVYNQGLFGLSTAGNVVMFLIVSLLAYPLFRWLNKREEE
jgi:raffinose/stachyose/melibiose transport system permease protein